MVKYAQLFHPKKYLSFPWCTSNAVHSNSSLNIELQRNKSLFQSKLKFHCCKEKHLLFICWHRKDHVNSVSVHFQCCTLLNSNWPSYKEKTIYPKYYVRRKSSYICLLRPRRIFLCTAILQKTNSLTHIGLCKNELQYKYKKIPCHLFVDTGKPISTLIVWYTCNAIHY